MNRQMPSQTTPMVDSTAADSSAPVRVVCQCGRAVELAGTSFVCSCGTKLGYIADGLAVLPPPAPYWGEISQDEMRELLAVSLRDGWRQAMHALPPMQHNIMDPERAAFQDVLPIPDNSFLLDVGAGLGNLSVQLSKNHRVVALEGVPERAQFIALRKRQDSLHNLQVVNADLNAVCFAPSQFDVIVVNGVLEWVGLFDRSMDPEDIQRRFLQRLRNALRPGGFIYIGIENRIGLDMLRGGRDHSGVPYTSLLPRRLADYVCQHGVGFRSPFNTGYRTYTYSYYGYKRLFRHCGLEITSAWVAPYGYNRPITLVPMNKAAIDLYVAWNWQCPPISFRAAVKNHLKMLLGSPLMWKLFGSDFAFLLRSRDV